MSIPEAQAHGGALHGLRVLDLSRVLAGPLCTMVLGDLGADVLKVERPGTGDETRQWGPPWATGTDGARESAYYLCANRNKRSILADLQDSADRDRVLALAVEADVIVENFAPGTMDRFGLGYAKLAARNPRLVFCSITGYGSEGSDAGRPGYDFAVQARAGWMATTGEPDGMPVKVGFALADVLTGQNAAIAILAALRERDRSGRGQAVEVSLYDSALAGLVNVAQAALVTGEEPVRYGNAHPTIVPYQAFEAADRPFVVAVGNDSQWRRLCRVLDRAELAEDARFATNPGRVENRSELAALLASDFATADAASWIERLEAASVPCAPVQTVREALADEAARGRAAIWPMVSPSFGRTETVASPIRFARTPAALRRAPPALGEHDAAVGRTGWPSD